MEYISRVYFLDICLVTVLSQSSGVKIVHVFLSIYLSICTVFISQDLTFSAEGEADVIVQLHESELAEKRRMAKETEEAEEEDRRGGSYGRAAYK